MPVNKPAEVVDPNAALAAAEKDANSIDILVCGNCQGVFHFIEEFSEHKTKNDCEKADKSSTNLQQSNKKPQVWAFLIWKNSQQHKSLDQQGSWQLYQKWCNMPESQRQSWVTAGRNIQTFINLSHARDISNTEFPTEKVNIEPDDDVEENFVVEKIVGKRYNQKKRQVEYFLKWEGYPPEQNTWEPLSNLTTCKSLLQEYERTAAQNDKSFNSKLTGVLKRDLTPAQVKLQNTNSTKPTGIIPNRPVYGDRSKDLSTPTLQTQRKIVPVTPLPNSVTPNKISIPILSPARTEANKPGENCKTVNNIDLPNDVTVTKVNKSTSNPTPLKKRLVSVSEDNSLPVATSPEVRNAEEKTEPTKEWCITIDDDDDDVTPAKKRASTENSNDDAKRVKPNEPKDEVQKFDDTIEISKSGIFKKSDLKEQCPSISNMFGKNTENADSKSENSKNKENLRGLLRVDHSQLPEIVAGIYKMTLSAKGTSAKIDLLHGEKQLSAILLTMPGPRGGVIVLSNRLDLSKVVQPKPVNTDKTVNTTKVESPAFRGIFPKNKLIEDSPSRKPDLNSKNASVLDSGKKPLNSSLRKVLGSTMPRAKGRTNINSPTGISRFKLNYVKSHGDTVQDNTAVRVGDGDNLLVEFGDCDNSDLEDYSLPDDFPEELDLEPLSPTRPLTLDPETGKRLMRAEGEPTPQPTPEPSPEPSPVPSPVPTQVLLKEEKDSITVTENLILKTDDTADGETYAEIDGNTFKVTNAAQVGLLQNATFTQDGEIKGIPVAGGLTDEETADGSNMLTITGDDGLVYQVANAKLEGDTIVVASGEDDQQCVFVTEDGHQVMQRTNEDGSTVLTLESAYADAVAQLVPNQVNILPDGSQIYVKQEENGQVELVQIQSSDVAESEVAEQEEGQMAEAGDENSGQVVAQLIEAGEPAPGGGPRRVVLLLPDGNIMVTEVDEEQFAALELEKQ